jgi:periplasmic protein TonB
MDIENRYFYTSGLLATFIFVSVFFLFVSILFYSTTTKSYAMKESRKITVSIVLKNHPIKIKAIKHKAEKKGGSTKLQHEIAQPNIQKLFSNVWTRSPDAKQDKTPQKEDKRVIQEISKKLVFNNQQGKAIVRSKNLENNETAKAAKVAVKPKEASSTSSEVNQYLAKIQAIVYDNFYPPANTQGQTARVLLRLSEAGSVLSFRILIYSNNQMFNNEIDRLKNRIMSIEFPSNPQGKAGDYIVTLTAKE